MAFKFTVDKGTCQTGLKWYVLIGWGTPAIQIFLDCLDKKQTWPGTPELYSLFLPPYPLSLTQCTKFIEIKVSAWQDNNDDILLHQWRSSVPGPNQVGREGLIADNSSLSMLVRGWEESSASTLALEFPSNVTTNQIIWFPIPSSLFRHCSDALTFSSIDFARGIHVSQLETPEPIVIDNF